MDPRFLSTALFRAGPYVFTVHAVACMFTSLCMAGLAGVTLVTERRSSESLSFSFLAGAAGLWLFAFSWMYAASSAEAGRTWARAAYLGVPFIAPAAYQFASSLRGGLTPARRVLTGGLWALAATFTLLIWSTDLVVGGLHRYEWGYYPAFQPAAVMLVLFLVLGLAATLGELWRGYRRAERLVERRRLGWVLSAFGVAAVALTDFLPSFGVAWVPLGYVFILAFLGLIGWTVRRYHFVDFTPAFAAEKVLETMADAMVVCDEGGTIRLVNSSAQAILGYREGELTGAPVDVIAGGDADAEERLAHALGQSLVRDQEITLRTRDGEAIETSVSVTSLEDRSGREVGSVVIARDLRERKEFERELERQALEDTLTDLPNRRLFGDRLRHALARAARQGTGVAVAVLDLDRFKIVNETLGHRGGDELLRAVARRIGGSLREEDTVARFGGDEFAVLLEEVEGAAEASQPLDRLIRSFDEPFEVAGTQVHLDVSAGVALSPQGDEDPDDLVRYADIAMYRAKETEGSHYRLFDPEEDERATGRLHRENALRRAIHAEQFELHYQPVVELESGSLRGVEALVRWRHPEQGLVSPGEFMPLAEDTGLVVQIGRWVLREASRRASRWREAMGPEEAPLVGINLSGREFEAPGLPGAVEEVLEITGLDPGGLVLEITETVAMRRVERLRQLAEVGVRLAVDDFGTGYSSLSYLARLPLDIVKIDRSFVREMAGDATERVVVEAIVRLAGRLDLTVVAEGIETRQELELLRGMGCETGQGYYFARPVPAAELEERMLA